MFQRADLRHDAGIRNLEEYPAVTAARVDPNLAKITKTKVR